MKLKRELGILFAGFDFVQSVTRSITADQNAQALWTRLPKGFSSCLV